MVTVDFQRWMSRCAMLLVAVLLVALPEKSLGGTTAVGIPMSNAEMAKQATQQSAAAHRIQLLANGRALVPAPLQALEATVTPEGISVVSTAKGESGTFVIRAESLGRAGSAKVPLSSGKVSVDGQLARIVHPGLTEELTSSADGVRQDFVVTTAPQGKGDLVLELRISEAMLDRSGEAVALTLESGRELLYHRLLVTDSAGRKLSGRFELLDAERLRIVVADAGAAYPVRIDPTITDADWASIAGPDTNGTVYTILVAGSNLYAAGDFTAIGGILANRIAQWNGNSWAPLGAGMNSYIKALTWDGTNLFAGGNFTTAGGVSATYIAQWNGNSWVALGSGMNSSVNALAWDGTNLYAGGNFTTSGGTSANRIAQWNGNSWAAMGSGMNGSVNAFAWDGTNLYAGGNFTTAGGVSATRVAKWNGSSWAAMGSGLSFYLVNALAWDGTNLYVGGGDGYAGGAAIVSKWSGSSWSTQFMSNAGAGSGTCISALAWDGTNLYAGGNFESYDGNYLVKWNGSSWSAAGWPNGVLYTLAWDGSSLYAGGSTTDSGGYKIKPIAKWNGSSWSALGNGMNGNVLALAWDGTNLYAGGDFTAQGGLSANYIAKWNGSSWSSLGSGVNGYVKALAWTGTNLYVGGEFSAAGVVSAYRIAKWNGSSWSALGSGMVGFVYALAWDGTNLYAGGNISSAGGVSASHIAKWNGSNWSALGSGMNNYVRALAWDGTNLYAGGDFTTAGGVSSGYIAKWNGSSWAALGSGMGSSVSALAWDGTNLYAGGGFTIAGGLSAKYIAQWNGGNWSPLGSGMSSSVSSLAWDGTTLYAGGSFTTAGGASANRIALWDGSNWSGLGSGMNNTVSALVWSGSKLYAGGSFSSAGGTAAKIASVELNHTVTATAGTGGSISPTSVTVYKGTTTTFTITPESGNTIADVTGCGGTLTGSTYTTGPITAPCTISATFTIPQFTLGITVTGSGTVHTSPGTDIQCTGSCGQGYNVGTVVTITPDPGSGYSFAGWGGACSGSGACQVTMDDVKSVTAAFTPAFTLTAPSTTNVGANMASLILQSSATGTGYFTLLSGNNATCGSGTRIKAGQTSAGATAPYHGSLPLVANMAGNYTVRNLTQSTDYTICFTADDGANLQPAPVAVNLTTAASVSYSTPGFDLVGNAYFSAGQANSLSLAFAPDGTPYVAYEDVGNDSKATVMKYNGSNWITVGNAGFSVSAAGLSSSSLAFAPDGTPYVAYEDVGNNFKTTVMKYNGSDWVPVGNAGFSTGRTSTVSLAFAPDGTPYVAYNDMDNGPKATVMKYDGSNWITLGSTGLSDGVANYITLAFAPDGSPYMAFQDNSTDIIWKATVMKYDGIDTWFPVGNAGFSAGQAAPVLAMAPNGTPYVAYSDVLPSGDTYTYKATVMKFNGAAWVTVGVSEFTAADADFISLAIAPDGTPYVAFSDGDKSRQATLMKYDGAAWVRVGNAGFSESAADYISLAFAPNGTPYVAYSDMLSGTSDYTRKAAVMRLGNFPPVISGTPVPFVTVGTTYSFIPGARNAENFSVTGALPPGLSFSPINGSISGTPTTAGSYSNIIITANNAVGGASLPAFSITVVEANVDLNITVTGSGSVYAANLNATNEITCSGTCNQAFKTNTLVTLTPTAGTGYTFNSWGGACSGSGSCTVFMDQAKNVTATFTDTTPPDTAITSSPANPTSSTSFSFSFTATEAGSTFECRLNNGAWDLCTTPYSNSIRYTACTTCRTDAPMSFSVRAKDPAGNTDPTPAGYSWTISNPLTNLIDNVLDNGLVQLQATDLTQAINITRPVSFTLKGGFSSDYLTSSGVSTIHGSINISAGTVAMENIVIMP